MSGIRTISPVDGSLVVAMPFMEYTAAEAAVSKAQESLKKWQAMPLVARITILRKAVDYLVSRKKVLAEELTWQMGRPVSQTAGEIDGMAYRANHMLGLAEEALADRHEQAPEGLTYFIRRQPFGVVFAITPWNYPYLTAINIIVPALAAGNAMLLKPSPQTPLVGDSFAEAFTHAGLPAGVFQTLHLSPESTESLIREADINHVGFTGSVENGAAVERASAGRFLSVGLELGGKDAAYVRADADIPNAVASLVDGAFFNSGQSCCGIERIYVANAVYDEFVSAYVEGVKRYKLGNPLDSTTSLGPVVNVASADRIRSEIAAACAAGATPLIPEGFFPVAKEDTAYIAPQVLVNVNHHMEFMRQETFGPCVGIMPVKSDEQAIDLVNDSPYGLTASVWSNDQESSMTVMEAFNVGTVYLNRCDALEPALAWTGVKHSGRGCTLSRFGYDALTRPKSFNLVLPE